MMTLVSNQRLKRWGLLGIVLIVSLSIWVGNQVLYARQGETSSDQPLGQRVSMSYASDSGLFEISGLALSELEQLEASVTGNNRAWTDIVSLHIALPDQEITALPAVIGTYEVRRDSSILVFQPRFGWSAGQTYVAIMNLSAISAITMSEMAGEENVIEWTFLAPETAVPDELPTVTTIYPTADELPENLLRFYIMFSQPMQRGNVYDVVQLLDANGNEVEYPFLRIGQEFWDQDMQVLTIILDPGRIKQGVAPNIEAGAPLINEGHYELVIGTEIIDAHGRPLGDTVSKVFTVIMPDHLSPDPEQWVLNLPDTNTRDSLTINLDSTIDPIIAPRLIRVQDQNGQSVPVTYSFTDEEQMLHLTPVQAWTNGRYRLVVHPTLEDYAGNRVESLFDMPEGTVADLAATASERQPIYIDFHIGES